MEDWKSIIIRELLVEYPDFSVASVLCAAMSTFEKQSQFSNGQSSVKSYAKGEYKEFHALEDGKKQTQIKANLFRDVFCMLRDTCGFLLSQE